MSQKSHQPLPMILSPRYAAAKIVYAAVTILIGMSPTHSSPTPESIELARSIQIADVHMHTVRGFDEQWLLDRMNRNNVQWGGAVGGQLFTDPTQVKAALGNRYIAAFGQAEFTHVVTTKGEAALLNPAEPEFLEMIKNAELALENKLSRGFGEIHVSNRGAFGAPLSFQREISLKSPVVRQMFTLADRYSGFVQVHATRGSNFDEIAAVAQEFKNARFVLSHCLPGSSASDIRVLLQNNSNLYCELSGTGPFHKNQRVYTSGGPWKAWLEVIESYPDRFMVGSDAFLGVHLGYDQILSEIRNDLLPHLKQDTIRKVAFENAVRVFALD
jgi:hypothetical protein